MYCKANPQPWNMEIPYVTGIGGFGTIAGDDAAASRYTEAKLAPPVMS